MKDAEIVDASSMNAGIELVSWFKHEARRVYAMLIESDVERNQRQLVEWITRKGGTVTAREVQQGCRWLKAPGAAETALEALVKAAQGTWLTSPAGQPGQPTRRFKLSTVPVVYGNVVSPGERTRTVDVDIVEGSKDERPPDGRSTNLFANSQLAGPYRDKL